VNNPAAPQDDTGRNLRLASTCFTPCFH